MGFFRKNDNNKEASFNDIDSNEKAIIECSKGNLEKLYLVSPIFGGAEDASNTLYVPIGVNKIKEQYDNIIADLLKQGKVESYNCFPEYKGNSFVPSKITIRAGKNGKDIFVETINIW